MNRRGFFSTAAAMVAAAVAADALPESPPVGSGIGPHNVVLNSVAGPSHFEYNAVYRPLTAHTGYHGFHDFSVIEYGAAPVVHRSGLAQVRMTR